MHRTSPWFWLILWLLPAVVQGQDVFTLTAESLQNGQAVELDKLGWKYSPNDDPRFADPQFDDRVWTTLASSAKPQDSPSGWRGIGWFRLHLRVAPELADVALNLEMAHLGASEVYINGTLVRRFGVVGKTLAEETGFNPNALPLGVVLETGTEQVIAVRHSNQQAANMNSFLARWMIRIGENPSGIEGVGFHSRVREFGTATGQPGMVYGITYYPFGYLIFQIAAHLSFGILHLLLFVFFSRQRSNFFYSLYLLGQGGSAAAYVALYWPHYRLIGYFLLYWANSITFWWGFVMLLAFLYSAFTPSVPRRIWVYLGDDWGGARPQDDDVTLVVLKMR